MFKKSSNVALLTLIMVVFLLLNLSWAKKSSKDKEQGYLGVYLQELTSDLKESLDLDESTEGILVSGVVEDSPAEEAGLEDGDVIISFKGKKVYSTRNLSRLVRKTTPGTKVKLEIIRDGEKKRLKVTIGERSSTVWYDWSPERLKSEFGSRGLKKKRVLPFRWSYCSGSRMGISVQDLTEQLGDYFGVKNGEGALITEVEKESPADQTGLKAGDVIVEIDNRKIKGTEDLLEVVSDKEKGERIELEVLRNKNSKKFSLTIEEEEWSAEFFEDIEKIKLLPKKLERIEIPEVDIWREYSFDERKLKRELKELKKELEELKEDLERLREEIR